MRQLLYRSSLKKAGVWNFSRPWVALSSSSQSSNNTSTWRSHKIPRTGLPASSGRHFNMSAVSSSTAEPLQLRNVLNDSRSPYVRGHMNNPVAWQMWEPNALALAKKYNRLLFVSIGYAACHWCHVMERESFENEKIASVLNSSFIPIKIDREERPDIDRIYMNYVQATSGRGGWPLNVFLTPDLEPLFGGTYFPGPDSAMLAQGHMGFLNLLERIKTMWETQPERCLSSAKSVTEQLRAFADEGSLGDAGKTSLKGGEDSDVDLDLLEEAYQSFASRYDSEYGGFGRPPKFPTPANLAFLLSLGQYSGAVKDVVGHDECDNARKMVVSTLRNMTRNGIHDLIGNGFARYSVTRDWRLPHFEKMLYDQGQLLNVYLDAFLVSGDAEMLGAVYDIAKYLTTPPLASPGGGVFSSEDADSYYREGDAEKREGAFYVFTYKEFQDILGERDAEICAKFYNVKRNGNVAPEFDAHDELADQNVLSIVSTPDAVSKEFGLTKDEVVKTLKNARQKLLQHRNTYRPRPALDDKIVAGWNGMAIGALARTSSMLAGIDPINADIYRAAAIQNLEFIKRELFDEETKTMKRVYREGPGDAPAFADDYAYLIQGLLELYEATFDDSYLQFADTLQTTQNSLFHDSQNGGYFTTPANQPDALLRLKDANDAAEPSTNGITASNLYRLSSYLEDENYANLARSTVLAFAAEMTEHPFLFASLMSSVVAARQGMRSVVVTGSDDAPTSTPSQPIPVQSQSDSDSVATADPSTLAAPVPEPIPPQTSNSSDKNTIEMAVRTLRARLKLNTTVIRLRDPSDTSSGSNEVKSDWLVGRNELLKHMDLTKRGLQVCESGACREVLDFRDVEKVLGGGTFF